MDYRCNSYSNAEKQKYYTMSAVDKKLSKSDEEAMKKLASDTDNPQLKRTIDKKLNDIKNNQDVKK